MDKMYSMLIFLIVTILLFNLAGLTTSEPYLIQKLNIMKPESFSNTEFYGLITIALLGVAAGGAIAIGILTKQDPMTIFMNVVTAGFVSILFFIALDIIQIGLQVSKSNEYLGLLVTAPLVVCYVLVVVDWWRSRS